MRTTTRFSALVIACALIAAACSLPQAPSPRLPANGAVFPQPFADPAVVKIGDTYHAWATGYTNFPYINVPYAASEGGLNNWNIPTGALSWAMHDAMPQNPPWARQHQSANIWAPSVLPRNGGDFLMYYTAQRLDGLWCIGVAKADAPEGPFEHTVRSNPLMCQAHRYGSIDPDVFRDPRTGHLHLYWKSEGHGVGELPMLWHQRLTASGEHLTGPARALMAPARNLFAWEGTVLENPAMTYRSGAYWFFFSANDWWTARYATGVARCDSPAGPCTRVYSTPILGNGHNVSGAGGASVVRGQNNLLAFHAWEPGKVGYHLGERRLYFVNWNVLHGRPYVR